MADYKRDFLVAELTLAKSSQDCYLNKASDFKQQPKAEKVK